MKIKQFTGIALLLGMTTGACGSAIGDEQAGPQDESIGRTTEAVTAAKIWTFAPKANWTGGAYFGDQGTFFADVTGDGFADAIAVNNTVVAVRRSNRSSAFNANEFWTSGAFFGDRGTFFADVTGDGSADAIAVNNTLIAVRRSNGSSFNANEFWTSSAYFGTRGTFFADVTGDGKADAIVVNDGGITVRRSNGSAFAANETWTSSGFFGSVGTFFADVTGDGRADAIAVNGTQVVVRRSNGSSFQSNEVWINEAFFGDRATFFDDIDGDGMADAVAVNHDGAFMRRSNGWFFAATFEQLTQPGESIPSPAPTMSFARVGNSKKRADFTQVLSDGVRVSVHQDRQIPVRFVQFVNNATDAATSAQLDNVIATANKVYQPLNLSFFRQGNHVVTSAALADLSSGSSNTAAEVAKAKDSFNPGCNIGDVAGIKEVDQVSRVAARCGFNNEVLVYVANYGASFGQSPWDGRMILLTPGDITFKNSTNMLFSHEMGHYLGLPHVFDGATKDPQTGQIKGSLLWDLVYAQSGSSLVTFNSQAEAAAFESSLLPIQASNVLDDLNNGWYCPSADANRPCPANAPNYTVCLKVAGTTTFCSGEQRMKGLGLRLPNNTRTFNVMSYNYRAPSPDPNDAQQTTPGISVSQMEQIRRSLQFDIATPIRANDGTFITGKRPEIGL